MKETVNGFERFIAFFLSIVIFSQSLIYSVFAIFDLNASSANNIYFLTLGAVSWIIIFYLTIKNHKITLNGLIVVAISFGILVHYISCVYLSGRSDYFLYYILWGITPVLLSVVLNKEIFLLCIRYIEVINLIQSIACILSIYRFYFSGNRIVNNIQFGGVSYQTISYTSATCIGLFLYYLFFCDYSNRFELFKKKLFSVIYVALMVLSAFSVLISGGRGGAVLLLVYVLLFIWHFNTSDKYKYRLRTKTIINMLLAFGIFFLVYYSINNEVILGSLNRTFSYIINGHFDIKQTSGRDIVYSQAISRWNERFLLGYGPMNYAIGEYPHNLFLDLALAGGLIYLVGGVIFLAILFNRILYTFKNNSPFLCFSFISISVFISLMFSGTFFTNVSFWIVFTLFIVILNKSDIDEYNYKGDYT